MNNKEPILICFGTRPEWLKIRPIIEKLERNQYKLLFTGQHVDLLSLVDVDFEIKIDSTLNCNRLDSIVVSCICNFPNESYSAVLVQGDTASAFACAISAFHRGIPIYYLESGLRSYDLNHPYPEEGYRQMISRISNINFTPTEISAENLSKERVSGSVYVVGNTVLDNLTKCGYGVYGNKIIVTIHRRENHDIIHEWFSEINKLAIQYPYYEFILPIHPNPNVRKHINLLTDVNVVEPMHHDKLIQILKDCRLIITDSGGLQEEGSFFNKKVIVCRKTTERPEGIATGHLHMCQSPAQLHQLFYDIEKYPFINEKCPYGDGNSSEIVKKIINEEFQRTFF